MNLLVLQQYIPAVDAVVASLGEVQKDWLHKNSYLLAPFFQSDDGRDALKELLTQFFNFTVPKVRID